MPKASRPTENVVAIFSAMLEQPTRSWYGLQLSKRTGIGSATIYAALTRLERDGLLEASWEAVDPAAEGRPRRRLYKLTALGEPAAAKMLAEYQPRLRPTKAWPGWLPGPEGRTTEPLGRVDRHCDRTQRARPRDLGLATAIEPLGNPAPHDAASQRASRGTPRRVDR